MVRVFFANGNRTDVSTATSVGLSGFMGGGEPGFSCVDASGTVVASFRNDQVVGYQIEDGQLSASSDSKVSAEGAL